MAPLRSPRRYKKRAGAKRSAIRRAGVVKRSAIRRAGGRRKYGQRIQRYNTMAGLLTNSVWSYKARALPPRVRAMKAVGAPDIYHANFAETLTVQPGLQKFRSYPTLVQPQLTAILDSTPSGTPNRVCLESCQTEITMTNTTNAAAEVEIYDIMFKRDVGDFNEFDTSNNTGYQFKTIESMITVGAQASANLAPSSGVDPSTYVGASAFDSQVFKDYCRVVKRQHIMLASGASHRHQSLIGINKIINRVVGGNTDLHYVKGYSYASLLLVRGVGAYAPETGNATVNNVFLNVVTSVRAKYTFVADNTNTVFYHNYPLPQEVPNVRNIGSGAYETVTP